MFKFLFVMFFFFILLVFLMGFSILRTIKNILFGNGNNGRKEEQRSRSYETRSNNSARNERTSQTSRKKIFAEDEGEYVDYEEVK